MGFQISFQNHCENTTIYAWEHEVRFLFHNKASPSVCQVLLQQCPLRGFLLLIEICSSIYQRKRVLSRSSDLLPFLRLCCTWEPNVQALVFCSWNWFVYTKMKLCSLFRYSAECLWIVFVSKLFLLRVSATWIRCDEFVLQATQLCPDAFMRCDCELKWD